MNKIGNKNFSQMQKQKREEKHAAESANTIETD